MENKCKDSNSRFKIRASNLILGLIGSPRKLGNCEVFVKEIARSIPGRLPIETDKAAST